MAGNLDDASSPVLDEHDQSYPTSQGYGGFKYFHGHGWAHGLIHWTQTLKMEQNLEQNMEQNMEQNIE